MFKKYTEWEELFKLYALQTQWLNELGEALLLQAKGTLIVRSRTSQGEII